MHKIEFFMLSTQAIYSKIAAIFQGLVHKLHKVSEVGEWSPKTLLSQTLGWFVINEM